MLLSLVIPAKDKNDPKLSELLKSIEAQDFPKEQMETLVITDGTSESAKAIGIRKAQGEVIGILASDNELTDNRFLSYTWRALHYYRTDCAYPAYYAYKKEDDSLNRYFSLIGGNDVLSIYMGKNDRIPCFADNQKIIEIMGFQYSIPSLGDNGFFIWRKAILEADLDNYSHIDVCEDLRHKFHPFKALVMYSQDIWHKTGGNIFKFFAKRYHYGLQHAFSKNRRWHLVDFSKPKDIRRLLWFIFVTLTVIEPLCLSIRGYLKVRDVAWFLHPLVCLMTLFTYGLLALNLGIKRLFRLLSAPMAAKRA